MLLMYLYQLSMSPNCSLMKFISVCSEFGVKIFYRQGKQNAVANVLSRIPWDEPPFQPGLEFDLEGFDADDFAPAVNFMMNELPLSPKGINIPDIPPETLSDILNAQNYDRFSNAVKRMLDGHGLPMDE